jgi:predicted XRE-type DNA-binding protein
MSGLTLIYMGLDCICWGRPGVLAVSCIARLKGGPRLKIIRIGDKIISYDKIFKIIDRILSMRAEGFAQQEVADKLDIDRSFVSRLENLGEIRKGERIALVGFPVANKDELTQVALNLGVDFIYLLNNTERWDFVREKSGAALQDQT